MNQYRSKYWFSYSKIYIHIVVPSLKGLSHSLMCTISTINIRGCVSYPAVASVLELLCSMKHNIWLFSKDNSSVGFHILKCIGLKCDSCYSFPLCVPWNLNLSVITNTFTVSVMVKDKEGAMTHVTEEEILHMRTVSVITIMGPFYTGQKWKLLWQLIAAIMLL